MLNSFYLNNGFQGKFDFNLETLINYPLKNDMKILLLLIYNDFYKIVIIFFNSRNIQNHL